MYNSFGDKQIRYVSGNTCLKCLSPLGKSSAFLGMSVSDLWRGIVSGKSQVSKLKNWMSKHSKKKKKMPSVGDMRQWPKRKKKKKKDA